MVSYKLCLAVLLSCFVATSASAPLALVRRILAGGYRPYQAPPPPQEDVTRTKNCPPGYDMVGKTCVREEQVPPNFVCPTGTSQSNGVCATFRQANRNCPPGFQLFGDNCQMQEVRPPSFHCDHGSLDASGRGCRLVQAAQPNCGNGYTMENGECVRYSPKQKTCPPGFVSEGKNCMKQVSFTAAPVCQDGFVLEGDRCTKEISVPPRCQAGYTMEGFECVRSTYKISAPCPPGTQTVGENCQRLVESPPAPVCPPSYTLEGSACTKQVLTAPTCPSGTSRGSSGECERPVQEVPQCPNGMDMTYASGRPMCQQVSRFAASPTCSNGFDLVHGKCKKVDREPPLQRCSGGATLQNGMCASLGSTTPRLLCPVGFELAKGSTCVQDVSYDCSRTVSRLECDMPDFVNQLTQPPMSVASFGKTRRVLRGNDYKSKDSKGKASAVVAAPPQQKSAPVAAPPQGKGKSQGKEPTCHQVPQTIAATCTRVENAPVEMVCPNGNKLVGKSCTTPQSADPEVYCRRGRLDKASGQCMDLAVQPPQMVCPNGANMENGQCVTVNTQVAQMICPNGSTRGQNGCAVRSAMTVVPPRVVQEAPQFVCPVGERRGNACVEVIFHPRDRVCPTGTRDDGNRCVLKAAVQTPPAVLVNQPARYICPDGRPASGQSCYEKETAPSEYVCGTGLQSRGDRCAQSTPLNFPPARVTNSAARPVCNNGYTLQGDRCVAMRTERVALSCAPGYEANMVGKNGGQECRQTHMQVPVCPAGTQQAANGCTRKSFAPLQVTEVRRCTKGQPGCTAH